MIVTNKRTGKDITGLYIKYLSGEMSQLDFEIQSGLSENNDISRLTTSIKSTKLHVTAPSQESQESTDPASQDAEGEKA